MPDKTLHDAVIIGGSYAGLSAAMQLVRARRRVLIIDDGRPRNRFASHAHGLMGQDGRPGGDILADARAMVAIYPTAVFHRGEAVAAEESSGLFHVKLDDGAVVRGRRLLLAHGVEDVLPDIPGLKARWGRSVLHCPYCHGYEIEGGPIGVLAAGPQSVHHALLIAEWGETTLFLNGTFDPDEAQRALLARRGVRLEPGVVTGLEGAAPALEGVRLDNGRLAPARALFVPSVMRQPGGLAEALGCEREDTPLGPILRTDDWKLTTRPGVYAAGDAARIPSNISLASADGVMAGVGMHKSLMEEDAGLLAA